MGVDSWLRHKRLAPGWDFQPGRQVMATKRKAVHLAVWRNNLITATACRRIFRLSDNNVTWDVDLVQCGCCESRNRYKMAARDRETDIRRALETAEQKVAPWSWYVKGAKLIAMGVGMGKVCFEASTHY